MAEYQKLKEEEKKEEELYGKFETLRTRAGQTKAFDEYASKGEWEPISDLARAWDSTIRKDVLESAAKSLSGARCALAPAARGAASRERVPRQVTTRRRPVGLARRFWPT